jgi:diguanylate cyclase (GGDEF)-like protein
MHTNRNRMLLLIGVLAVVASLMSIALSYGVTESERQAVQKDAQRASDLLGLAGKLAGTVSAEHAAVDAYIISSDPGALTRYNAAVSSEAQIAGQIAADAVDLPNVLTELHSLADGMVNWRASFAGPTISAVGRSDSVALRALAPAALNDDQPIQAALSDLFAQIESVAATVRQRDGALNVARTAGTLVSLAVMFLAALIALWFVRRYGRELERTHEAIKAEAERSGVLNRFTEVTAFAVDDTALAAYNLEALALLVHPDAAVAHVLNRSKDRAVPEATLGEPIAEVLALGALLHCPGIIRGGIYVVDDAAKPLSVHCPVYPVVSGTVACVPLAHGDTVGAIHLQWDRPGAFPLEMRPAVARVAEHAALAISNRRLVAALQGQATTDARTGLANSRAFDDAFEAVLTGQAAHEPSAVLMLDLDRFKDFNDRHGHPAGDEALRAFANVLRSCLRDGDLAARYGGEEFAVLLSGVDDDTALTIAERIRSRTESMLLPLAPGITDRITVSIGLAMAPRHGQERTALLRLADEALYEAKQAGRNGVRMYGTEGVVGTAPSVAS